MVLREQAVKYVYIGEWEAPTPEPRTPWANTVAYFPFTSSTTVYDQSWNNNDLTNAWGVVFTNDYAEWPTTSELYNNSFTIPSVVYMGLWVNATSFTDYNDRIVRSWNDVWLMYRNPWDNDYTFLNEKSGSGNTMVGSTPPVANKWYYVFTTWTNWSLKLWFIDNWTMVTTTSPYSLSTSGISLGIGTSSVYDAYRGYMSELIIEDKVWTDQEIIDYYDSMKANYWIS